jgi:hypothetical protein
MEMMLPIFVWFNLMSLFPLQVRLKLEKERLEKERQEKAILMKAKKEKEISGALKTIIALVQKSYQQLFDFY